VDDSPDLSASPVFPVPREEPKPEDEPEPGQCGSRTLPRTQVFFFRGPLGQGGRVKASPLTRCPGNTIGSKPQDRFYKEQFACIAAAGQTGDWVRGHILHGETERSGPRNLHGPVPAGQRTVLTWRELDNDDYFLEIWTDKVDPYCCLVGEITVDTFQALPLGGVV
jgi:hypothetical protein